MEVLRLNNIGLMGISTDARPWSLPPEFITSGINFRIFAGSILAKGGKILWSTAPAGWFPAHPFHVGSTSGDFWLVAGRSAIYAFDGSSWTDVSSVLGYGNLGLNDELLWTSCMLGAIPIFNNPQAQPEYWSPQDVAQKMQELMFDPVNTWTDKGYSAAIFRSHRNFLFAMNLTEGGEEFLDSFRWSHPADANGLPATWDETDPAFLAGKASLGGEGGKIIDAYTMRDAFCMYSESAVNVLDYTNDEFVWRRRKLSATVGLLATDCVIEVKGSHFFLADGDIVRNDGNKIESIAHDRIRADLSARIGIDNYERSYAVRNDSLKEVWFCIAEEGEEYPNIGYVYNYRDDSWAIRDLPDTVAFSNYGSQARASQSWDDTVDEELWDNQVRAWTSARNTPIDDTVVGMAPETGELFILDPSTTPDEDVSSRVERTDFPLVDDRTVTTITRVYPHITGEGTIMVQFGSQDYPGAPVRWKPALPFNPVTDRKVDLRTTGELHAWRFQSLGKTEWIMSGMTIEFEYAGLR